MRCRVVVESPHRHHHEGVLYNVRIEIRVPDAELVVKQQPDKDLDVAIRDAFDSARRQLEPFEELVCQLAREEEVDDKKAFFRVGTPDGGVEAYCILNNGNEYGWQAKFFDSMSNSQWRQLDDSFKAVFEKHPKLVKYFICTPLDRQDPRIEKQKWFMDKWNDKIAEWVKFAKSKKREIEFEYWGSSELVHRLSLKKHEGRRYFWFNKEELTGEWFSEKLDRSIDSLGNRYTPVLNFDLDIAKTFDGIARDASFKKQFVKWYDELLKESSKAINGLRSLRKITCTSYLFNL
jgi:hypothetical protein